MLEHRLENITDTITGWTHPNNGRLSDEDHERTVLAACDIGSITGITNRPLKHVP